MKKSVVILLILSLFVNIILCVLLSNSYRKVQEQEQSHARQILFAMQNFSEMNRVLQKIVEEKSIERYELSSLQHSVVYINAAFNVGGRLFAGDINTDNYHILFSYLTALEDIIYKNERISPIDDQTLTAFTEAGCVSGGKYEYSLAEYMEMMTSKIVRIIEQLNITEQPSPDGNGIVTIYPGTTEIKEAFVEIFE